jgi:hypothetical protein
MNFPSYFVLLAISQPQTSFQMKKWSKMLVWHPTLV